VVQITPLTTRVIGAGEAVLQLLDVYFSVMIQYGQPSHLRELLTVLFERIDQVQDNTQATLLLCY